MPQTYNYNRLLYPSGPITIDEFLGDNPNKIHQQLYKAAIKKFEEDNFSLEGKRVIEVQDPEYWKPSTIKVIDMSVRPRKMVSYSLEPYWDNIYVTKDPTTKEELGNTIDDISTGQENQYLSINHLDYLRGQAKLNTKFDTEEISVDFNRLDENTKMSPSFDIQNDTFKTLYLNEK